MKFLLVIALLLTGCDDMPRAKQVMIVLPDSLSDCKYYEVRPSGTLGPMLHLIRCPNSRTSISDHNGKSITNIQIDDSV